MMINRIRRFNSIAECDAYIDEHNSELRRVTNYQLEMLMEYRGPGHCRIYIREIASGEHVAYVTEPAHYPPTESNTVNAVSENTDHVR